MKKSKIKKKSVKIKIEEMIKSYHSIFEKVSKRAQNILNRVKNGRWKQCYQGKSQKGFNGFKWKLNLDVSKGKQLFTRN